MAFVYGVRKLRRRRSTALAGGDPLRVWDHVEWILQRPFQNVTEWLSEEADRWRNGQVMGVISEQFKADWAAYRDAHRDWTLAEVQEQLKSLRQRFEQKRAAGIIKPLRSRTQRWQRRRRLELAKSGIMVDYVRWLKRKRRRREWAADLVEGYRDAYDQPRQRFVIYLGAYSDRERDDDIERRRFWDQVTAALDKVDRKLTAEQRMVIEANIARRVRR